MTPIVEITMKRSHNPTTDVVEIKDIKVLIQESFIKIDIVFVTAISNFFTDKVIEIFSIALAFY